MDSRAQCPTRFVIMPRLRISDKQRSWLMAQIAQWRGQEILTQEQASLIIDSYESALESSDRKRTMALRTVMGIAALLLGLGVLSLVGYNWERMSATWKLLVIFGAILATYASAFYVRISKKLELLSEVLFLIGSLFYGIGIFLIAQIFHLNAHYPDGVWWWALGVIPIAMAADSLIIHALLCGLLAVWCGMELSEFDFYPPETKDLWSSFFAASSLPVLVLPTCIWAYSKRSLWAVWMVALLLNWWLILQPTQWGSENGTGIYVGTMGALMLLVAQCHRAKDRFAIPFRILGSFLSASALLLLSFYGFNKSVRLAGGEIPMFLQALVLFAVGIAIFVVFSLAMGYSDKSNALKDQRVYELVRRQWVPFSLFGLMFLLQYWQFIQGSPWFPTIASNIGMLALSLWLISLGLKEDRGLPFLAGVLYFLLWATVRYIDLFGDFGGLLGAALMFFLCSGTLFAVSIYWSRRGGRKDVRISH